VLCVCVCIGNEHLVRSTQSFRLMDFVATCEFSVGACIEATIIHEKANMGIH
jgi:hypothetical protein